MTVGGSPSGVLAATAPVMPDALVVEVLERIPAGPEGIMMYTIEIEDELVHSFVFRTEAGEAVGLYNINDAHSELMVRPAYRRQGIGTLLCVVAEEHLGHDWRDAAAKADLTPDGLAIALSRLRRHGELRRTSRK